VIETNSITLVALEKLANPKLGTIERSLIKRREESRKNRLRIRKAQSYGQKPFRFNTAVLNISYQDADYDLSKERETFIAKYRDDNPGQNRWDVLRAWDAKASQLIERQEKA